MMFTTCLLSVNKDFNILFIISALRWFMFPCAGTPLALPYQEFTKGPPALSPGRFREARNIRQGHGCR